MSATTPSFGTPPFVESMFTARGLKMAFIALLLGAAVLPMFWSLAQVEEAPIGPGLWFLVVVSGIANIVVIVYHYAIPAHPKFLMVPWRRFILRTHITAGTVELIAGLVAIFARSPRAAMITAIAALFFHVPSAFLQTPIVFGSKAVMVPSYVLCIITHAFTAGMLLMNPTSLYWAVTTFLVFNIYVWCRLYYYVFDWARLFPGEKYSISILAAGATMIPAAYGPAGFLLLAGFVGAFILLTRWLLLESPAEYEDFVREHARDATIDRDVASVLAASGNQAESEAAARRFFDDLDQDGDGQLTSEDLRAALTTWGLPPMILNAVVAQTTAAGQVDFPQFLKGVWSIGALRQRVTRVVGARAAESPRDKAELVFHQIDVNGDGFIDLTELGLLLLEWGLPTSEAARYLKAADENGDGKISFDEFLRGMKPVWKYIYYDVLQAEDATRNSEMIGRSWSAITDTRRTGVLRDRVKKEMVARVPFLSGASEALIEDLAASMVEEPFKTGDPIVIEGTVGDKFYLLASGGARVSILGDPISDLDPGACFGEGALLSDAPRSATVTASQASVLYSLSRASFRFLTEKYPNVLDQLKALNHDRRKTLLSRSMRTGMLGRVPFLKGATSELVEELASSLVPRRFRQGDPILVEGAPGDCLFLIESGAVSVTSNGRHVADIGPGNCLGEGALLSESPRSATAVALEDSSLLSLSREAFRSILAKYPDVQESLDSLDRQRRAANATS